MVFTYGLKQCNVKPTNLNKVVQNQNKIGNFLHFAFQVLFFIPNLLYTGFL